MEEQSGRPPLKRGPWFLYCAGIFTGRMTFDTAGILMAAVDLRQRTTLKEDWLTTYSWSMPLQQLQRDWQDYDEASWEGDQVTVANGAHYLAHGGVQGTVAGEPCLGQLWSHRDATALDVITVQGEIVAWIRPARYGMEVLVQPGYESLTPLVLYDHPMLSQPDYGVNVLGTFMVPMRDGVCLATDVYLPESGQPMRALPTILIRTCYDRHRNQTALMRWANRGYAVVNQDVRGRADSEGDLVPFYYERDDGSDTIDWIAGQSWSNGDVGMWGASYLGYVVVAAATSGNPHLKAVVDEVNVGSPFVDTVRRGGTVCSWPLLSWTLAQSVGTRTDFGIFSGETVNPAAVVDMRPIKDIPLQAIGRRSGPWDMWAEHPDYDDFWRECTFSRRGDRVSAPMLVISGWYDGDSAGVSETWRMLSQHNVPGRKIWLGPWEHNPNRARDFGGMAFSHDAVVYHYDIEILRWFDRYLKNVDNHIDDEPRATYYVVGENRWHTSSDWPPTTSRLVPFYLASLGHANSRLGDGTLNASMASTAPSDTFLYNPDDPMDDGGEREPENLRRHELRHDMLVYTSAPLQNRLMLAGELSCILWAASSAVDTDWAVTLSDVDAHGNSLRLSNYIVRAQYRHGWDARELLIPGRVEKYEIFLPNLGYTFEPGHAIRVSVTSSSKNVSFPNTNTGKNPYDDVESVCARQTIYHSPEYPSHILLPILEEP